jgi:hypothetical protein
MKLIIFALCMVAVLADVTKLTSTIGAYPGTKDNCTGTVSVTKDDKNQTVFDVSLDNLLTNCTCVGAACDDPANACGIHFHVGISCADEDVAKVGGHFYKTGIVATDPWTGANGAVVSPTTTSDAGANI